MEEFLIYLVKSSGILALFWCCFKLFLEKETLFTLHRVFLISGILLALLFPLWTLTEIVLIEPLHFTLAESTTMESTPISAPTFDWWNLVAILYACGVLVFLGRLGMQLLSLRQLIKKGTIVNGKGFRFIESKADTSPFSFFNLIVYNPAIHQPDELEKIIAHEKIHALQWHSLDILLIHIFSAFQWANPFVWLYKKSLSQNLEYIADQGVTKNMEGSKEYQYLLLKNASTDQQYLSIINPFFTSSIKKRIVMLNKNRSNKHQAWKFSLVVPFLAFFLVAFNTKTITRVNTATNAQESPLENGSTDTTKIEFTIYKTSTEEDLDNISSTLKNDYNVELSFINISRNSHGLITDIHSFFRSEAGSGSSTTSHEDGIKPFSFSMEIDKEGKFMSVGYTMRTKELSDTEKIVNDQKKTNEATTTTKVIGPINPIYVVDGVEVAVASKATGIDPSNIHSVNVLKGAAATNTYGEKAKDGVIEITTKSYHNAMVADKSLVNTQNNAYTYIKSDKEPLFVIDGVEKDADFNFGTIPPSSIESMNVFKGELALNKYGKKGEKNGVIEIITKKSEWKVQSSSNINVQEHNANGNNNTTASLESIAIPQSKVANTTNSKWKVGYRINMDDPNDIYDLTPFRQNGMDKAIIFVNGVSKGKNYVPTMKYSQIESTATFLPSAETTKKFGKQGKHGVIEITTKKE
ncbi:M56 family peptidase [Arenibacter sp. N53]|uniref:M56 family metallopeptidase n=1 Tax=Arenibacter TaxID=178469 RepID=UPI000CD43C2E|nr:MULTISPECIES: M56 family metallopeptidase [Arenibacter]MCM4149974.1 M56 family peptidase [Arenibacter sp. N53]